LHILCISESGARFFSSVGLLLLHLVATGCRRSDSEPSTQAPLSQSAFELPSTLVNLGRPPGSPSGRVAEGADRYFLVANDEVTPFDVQASVGFSADSDYGLASVIPRADGSLELLADAGWTQPCLLPPEVRPRWVTSNGADALGVVTASSVGFPGPECKDWLWRQFPASSRVLGTMLVGFDDFIVLESETGVFVRRVRAGALVWERSAPDGALLTTGGVVIRGSSGGFVSLDGVFTSFPRYGNSRLLITCDAAGTQGTVYGDPQNLEYAYRTVSADGGVLASGVVAGVWCLDGRPVGVSRGVLTDLRSNRAFHTRDLLSYDRVLLSVGWSQAPVTSFVFAASHGSFITAERDSPRSWVLKPVTEQASWRGPEGTSIATRLEGDCSRFSVSFEGGRQIGPLTEPCFEGFSRPMPTLVQVGGPTPIFREAFSIRCRLIVLQRGEESQVPCTPSDELVPLSVLGHPQLHGTWIARDRQNGRTWLVTQFGKEELFVGTFSGSPVFLEDGRVGELPSRVVAQISNGTAMRVLFAQEDGLFASDPDGANVEKVLDSFEGVLAITPESVVVRTVAGVRLVHF
jgi:hypothetical protein